MKAYVFPGQGTQFPGAGKNLYNQSAIACTLYEKANDLLDFNVTDVLFHGNSADLQQTNIAQLAVFLYSVIEAKVLGQQFKPDMVAGHSLGEFSALVAINAIAFEDGLKIVATRANAMQKACEKQAATMVAVLGLDDAVIESVCLSINETVVPANYNCPGQLVISGTIAGIEEACKRLLVAGAKRIIKLNVSGAFHSPLMEPATAALQEVVLQCNIKEPICPIYQNTGDQPTSTPETIKNNLIAQLTSPVRWTETIRHMLEDGATSFTELGPGNTLSGLIKKINPKVVTKCAVIGL